MKADLETLLIKNDFCQAELSLYGGQLLQWQPNGQEPVLWLSDVSPAPNKAIRGGVPICFPWFGPLQGKSQHGFARTTLWQLKNQQTINNGETLIELSMIHRKDDDYSQAFDLKQEIILGNDYRHKITVTNNASENMEISYGFHSYFQVSHSQNVSVPALKNSRYTNNLQDKNKTIIQKKTPDGIGPIEELYFFDKELALIDNQWQRKIILSRENTPEIMYWNPGSETVKSFVDINDGDETQFLCVEAVATQPLTLLPKESFTWQQLVKVETI